MAAHGPQRVQRALSSAGLDCEVKELPASARTAREAARAVGCEVARIAKSLVFRGERSGKAVLVVASGANAVDMRRLEAAIGEPVARPDAAFVREHTGYAIGGVPPLGHVRPVETLIDLRLFDHESVWAAAGGPSAVFEVAPQALLSAAGARKVDVASREGRRDRPGARKGDARP